ncbi:MAG TPA: DUF6209 family protein [Actinomycetota bacterium]
MTVMNDENANGSTKLAAVGTGPPTPTAATRRASANKEPGRAAPAQAIVQFLRGWVVKTSGEIYAGGRLLLEYDAARLAPLPCSGEETGPLELSAQIRFHPQGSDHGRSLFRFWEKGGRTTVERGDPWAHELQIPYGATHVEMWFRLSDAHGSMRWDSRFGQNYWFDLAPCPVNPPAIPAELVWYRPGAEPRPDMLNVVSESVPKGRQGDSPQTLMVATRLTVQAWGRTDPSMPAAAWVDIHIFDQAAQLIDSGTYPLRRLGAAGDGELFHLDETVYEASSLVPPGSVARHAASEALKLQYRIYLELDNRLFTDGLLHQHDLAQDAVSW